MLAKYRKFWVALLGAAIVALDQFAGISVGWDAEAVVNVLVPVLTAVGVWAVPNDPA